MNVRIRTGLALALGAAGAVASPLPAQEQGGAGDPRRAPAPELLPLHLYHPVGQPVPVMVDPGAAAQAELVLMDEAGLVLCVPRAVRAGVHDLAAIMPAVMEVARERQRACYLQLVVDEEPVGPALVVEPLLTRLVPLTEVAPHPTRGHLHTRITGWAVEDDRPPRSAAAAAPGSGASAAPSGGAAPATPPAWPAPPGSAALEAVPRPRVFTGLRLYVERDVLLRTSHGDVLVALRPDQAPNTAWNFRQLAEGGFYRGVGFHRVVPVTRDGDPFVIQAGDPSGTGDGGAGAWLPIEPSGLEHDFGVISMARADHPDSAGSQFFLCLSRAGTARLDGQYCAFGYAVEGAESILSIAAAPLADVAAGRPEEPPVIVEAILVPAPPRAAGRGRPDGRVARPEPAAPPARVPR
jgi:cyclophilin family peptidyl-prolyl cis-trans isomerase